MSISGIGFFYLYGGNTINGQMTKEDIEKSKELIPILYEAKSNECTMLNVMWCYSEYDAKAIIRYWDKYSPVFEYTFICAYSTQVSVEFDSTGKIVKLERILK